MTTEQATRTGHALSSIKTAIKREPKSDGRLPIDRDPAKNALATMLRKANEQAQKQLRERKAQKQKMPKCNDGSAVTVTVTSHDAASKEQGEDALSSVEFDNSHLLHFVPYFEEVTNIAYAEYDAKIVEQFMSECDQDIQKSLQSMQI